MARLIFPDEGSRLAYDPGTGRLLAAGTKVFLYLDAAATQPATDLLNADLSANTTGFVTLDAYRRLPIFSGPTSGADTLYAVISGGPVTPVYARTDDRLDGLAARVTTLETGGSGTAVQSVNGHTGTAVTVTKADVGLGNADNTADTAKPVSTAQQTALNAKADLVAGVVPTAQLPALAITDTFPVASQTAMLALTAQRGDVAIRSDLGKSFVLAADDPTVLANWLELSAAGKVTSVNGQQGVVVLAAADVGADASGAAAAAQAAAIAAAATDATTKANAGQAASAQKLVRTAVKTANYTAAAGDLVPCDTTSAAFTVTLPSAPAAGSRVAVKIVTLGTGNFVTIACGGSDVFNKTAGATTATLQLLGHAMNLQYDTGGIWTVVADDVPKSQLDATYVPLINPVPVGPGSKQPPVTSVADTTLVRAATRVTTPLTLTTPYGGTNTVVEPSVVYVPEGWGSDSNGKAWRHWVAMGPYENRDSANENPSLWVFDNWGDNPVVPPGGTNPIVPGRAGDGNNCDPGLFFDSAGVLYLSWTVQNSASSDGIWYKTSTDGITWSAATKLITSPGVNNFLSTRIQWFNGIWHAWHLDASGAQPFVIKHRTATTLAGLNAASDVSCTGLAIVGNDTALWEFEVIRVAGEWWMLLNTRFGFGNLCLATSPDGKAWTQSAAILTGTNNAANWDYQVYKSGFYPIFDGDQVVLRIMYNGWDNTSTSHVACTTARISDDTTSAGTGTTDVQTFTASGTWTKPANVSTVRVTVTGAGGGGGSGRRGAAASARAGGNGAGAGATMQMVFRAVDLAATETVTVGASGAGAAAVTVDSTSGSTGTAGGLSGFSSAAKRVVAQGGTAGAGGGTGAGSNAAGGAGFGGGNAGGSGGAAAVGAGGNPSAIGNYQTPAGGGAGGGITAADVPGAGGASAFFNPPFSQTPLTGGAASTITNGSDGATATGPFLNSIFGAGVGGSGGGASTAGTGGKGGDGSTYGAGGGGGGASVNGFNSGAGGAGAAGRVIVESW